MDKISIFWFRRDLRLEDNSALHELLLTRKNVLPIFIFDTDIIDELESDDPRVNFIYDNLKNIDNKLKEKNSSLYCCKGKPIQIWKALIQSYSIESVFINKDYEPYARNRDNAIEKLLQENNIEFKSFKDQVIHEENEVLKNDGTPYTVYTPYKNKWLTSYKQKELKHNTNFKNLKQNILDFPSMDELGFKESKIKVKNYTLSSIKEYGVNRDFPHLDSTSYLSPHLRFGTVSIRKIVQQIGNQNISFLHELIWREFFMQILFHFPRVIKQNFKLKYNGIEWLNNKEDFNNWCNGTTGYPMVDAGMRQLNTTGYMHNRVRMITAGFLCKHLLIDWRLGEAYFAKKLLDYELSSNNGNWQWAAGTGCDAAPYFRIFNPETQLKKFDKNGDYIKQWIPELETNTYPSPIIDHKFARNRALETYKVGIQSLK